MGEMTVGERGSLPSPVRRIVLAVAIPSLIATVGCGDENTRRPAYSSTATGTVTGTGGGGAGGAGGAGGEAGAAGSGAPPTGELGAIAHVDVPDTPCVPRGGTTVELYPGEKSAPVFGKLARVGSRRVAGGGLGLPGFITFDESGDGASPLPAITMTGGNDDFASEGETIGQAGIDEGEILYQRYDDSGAPVGSTVTLASNAGPFDPKIAGGDGESLVVWGAGGALHARGINASGQPAGPAFSFGADSFETFLRVVIARRPGGFAVAWTGDAALNTYVTRVVRLTLTDVEGQVIDITTAHEWPELSRLVKTPTGYAVLLTGPQPHHTPYALLLDESGELASAAHRLDGAAWAADLATRGTELGVVANRITGEPEFRAFDADLSPLGAWVCLDGPGGGSDDAGLDTDGAGYAVVYRRAVDPAPDGMEIFARVDHLGTGER